MGRVVRSCDHGVQSAVAGSHWSCHGPRFYTTLLSEGSPSLDEAEFSMVPSLGTSL